MKQQQKYKLPILFFLSGYLFLALSNHISVAEGQLGYFIKEGELFWQSGKILFSNTFSYTTPDFAVSNNHWLSAVIFYGVQSLLGFGGLHFLALITYLTLFLYAFSYFSKLEHPMWALIAGLVTVPFFATHNLIDPVLFTHLFSILFFLILHQFFSATQKNKWIYALPFFQLLWVNCHAYFFIGWGILGLGLIHSLLYDKTKAKLLGLLLLASILVAFLHPQFSNNIPNAFHHAFTNHLFLPIWERTILDAYLLTKSYILLYGGAGIFITILGAFFCLRIELEAKFFSIGILFLFSFFCLWSNQLIPLLGVTVLLLSFSVGTYYQKKHASEKEYFLSYSPPVLSLYLFIPLFIVANFWKPINNWGYGLRENETSVVEFINNNNIQGPFFHNTAISGLLTYGLEEDQLYISSQALAHPNEFYKTKYFPQILDPYEWKLIHDEYNFNAVIFRLKGETPANLEFLGNLLGNGLWVMVYLEQNYEVVLVKKNEQNQSIINQFEIIPNVQK